MDSQSVKTTESGGPRGFDAGKKTKGRKRHIVTDTDGNLLGLVTHGADVQDREGAPGVIAQAVESHPTLAHLFADSGYSGDTLRQVMRDIDGPAIEIVKRPAGVTGFVVFARRWVVERTFAWLGRCRRLAKDWEASIASADAWILIAAIRRSSRHVARKTAQES
jgi:transposase